MKRLFVGIITALCAIAVTAQLVPYRQLSTNEFKVGSFPAVQLRLNPTQFNTGGFPITITNVAGVFGAGGGSGITNLPANSPGYLTNNGTGTLSWVAGSGGGSGDTIWTNTGNSVFTINTNATVLIGNGGSYGTSSIQAFGYVDGILTGPATNGVDGLQVAVTLAPSSVTPLLGDYGYGLNVFMTIAASDTNNWRVLFATESYIDYFGTGDIQRAFGGSSEIYNESSGNIGEATGNRVAMYQFGSGVTTNAYGYRVYSSLPGTERNYGLFIPDVNLGSIENFAIKTGLGAVSFGDAVTTSSTLTTGDPGSGTAAWKLGKNITGTTATVCVTNWVEVMIGTNVYHLLRANE